MKIQTSTPVPSPQGQHPSGQPPERVKPPIPKDQDVASTTLKLGTQAPQDATQDMDIAKVEALKNAIRSGSYTPDSEQIAEAFLAQKEETS